MKKKTPQTITVKIPVKDLREDALDYMHDAFEYSSIHPDICPSDEEIKSRFNEYLQNPDFIEHIRCEALSVIREHAPNFFENYYEDDYIQDLVERSIDISSKELEQCDADKQKHIKSAMAKLTPEEREALGLKT